MDGSGGASAGDPAGLSVSGNGTGTGTGFRLGLTAEASGNWEIIKYTL